MLGGLLLVDIERKGERRGRSIAEREGGFGKWDIDHNSLVLLVGSSEGEGTHLLQTLTGNLYGNDVTQPGKARHSWTAPLHHARLNLPFPVHTCVIKIPAGPYKCEGTSRELCVSIGHDGDAVLLNRASDTGPAIEQRGEFTVEV